VTSLNALLSKKYRIELTHIPFYIVRRELPIALYNKKLRKAIKLEKFCVFPSFLHWQIPYYTRLVGTVVGESAI